jgi:hypothetical protein
MTHSASGCRRENPRVVPKILEGGLTATKLRVSMRINCVTMSVVSKAGPGRRVGVAAREARAPRLILVPVLGASHHHSNLNLNLRSHPSSLYVRRTYQRAAQQQANNNKLR